MREELREIFLIMRWDIHRLRRQSIFLAMRLSWFTIQVLIFAPVISSIVRRFDGFDYYSFYLLGVYASVLYSTGILRGYAVAEEFDDGVVDYHLSLPVRRGLLSLGRALGSSLASIAFSLPMMAVVLVAVRAADALSILLSIGASIAFSLAVVSFTILVVTSVKSTDITDILLGIIDSILIRLSTVFYPLPVIKAIGLAPYYYASLANPLSSFADLVRVMLLPEYAIYSVSPKALAIYLVALGMGLVVIAVEKFSRSLEAGGWK